MFAMIVGTHGKLAEELVETAKMIGGEAPNLRTVTLLPGEGPDDVVAKYRKALAELDTSGGVIFLNDLFGGSPYNAATRIIPENDNCVAIAGVNLPMLLELVTAQAFMPDTTLEEAVEKAVNAVKSGVQVFPEEKSPIAKKKAAETAASAPTPRMGHGNGRHMNIVLARIDDRLIHGQVATVWSKATNCQRIIVCDDDVAKDTVRTTLLKQVAPAGIQSHVVDLAKAVRVYNNPKYGDERCLLLFTGPQGVLHLIENGVPIKSVNIGGMSFKEGKHMITNAISVDDADIAAFQKLHDLGVELEVRKVVSDSKVDLMTVLK